MSNTDDDYKVGYGKPPKHKQYKPGETGNKNGRPKNFFHEVFINTQQEMITVKVNGKARKMTYQEAIIRNVVIGAANGNKSAVKQYIELMKSLPGLPPI